MVNPPGFLETSLQITKQLRACQNRSFCHFFRTLLAKRSEVAAETIRSGILKHVRILGTFPLIGPRYAKDEAGQTREIVYRSYRIFYRADETARRVEILTVWHGARGEPQLPNGPMT